MHLYEFDSLEDYEKKYATQDVQVLKQKLKKFRDQPRFQLHHKQMLVEHYYNTMDVMFLQEANVV